MGNGDIDTLTLISQEHACVMRLDSLSNAASSVFMGSYVDGDTSLPVVVLRKCVQLFIVAS